ncbi:Tetratricopeptide repeat protein 28 [Eumeta japonica]|uniref:Tetratricopeptide repeat protein 28 n=1 Tax=Eumeta variegata TaxID=151549 RepID=A0A4C2A7K2_EUMVA|nr:Tetratricopeptide repeat protein 28 [Eumeta japonica]
MGFRVQRLELSALGLSQLDAAIEYMQQDLAVAKSLGDAAGECRAHGNLGAAYFQPGLLATRSPPTGTSSCWP